MSTYVEAYPEDHAIVEGDSAVMFYGPEGVMRCTVAHVAFNADGSVRRVGVTPDGTDCVAWFYPVPDYSGMWNATNTVSLYV
jgi:hypothetical protein